MKNLLNCHGKKFSAKILNNPCTGIIFVENRDVFLIHRNSKAAGYMPKAWGTKLRKTKFSWFVGTGSETELNENHVSNFKIISDTVIATKKDQYVKFLDSLTDRQLKDFADMGFDVSLKTPKIDFSKFCRDSRELIITTKTMKAAGIDPTYGLIEPRRNGNYNNKGFWLSPNYKWEIVTDELGQLVLVMKPI